MLRPLASTVILPLADMAVRGQNAGLDALTGDSYSPFAWLQPALICGCINISYLFVTFFGPTRWYLTWAHHHGHEDRLPDAFLDHFEDEPWLIPVADAIPVCAFLGGCVLALNRKDIRTWSLLLNANGFLMIAKCIVEVVTTIPSSFGYSRCCAYLHIDSVDQIQVLNLDTLWRMKWGGCASMLWSGHTVQTMLGTYGLAAPLGSHPGWPNLTPQVMCAMLSASVIGPCLLLCRAHYSADVLLAVFITTIVLTNQGLRDALTNLLLQRHIPLLSKEQRPLLISFLQKDDTPDTDTGGEGDQSESEAEEAV